MKHHNCIGIDVLRLADTCRVIGKPECVFQRQQFFRSNAIRCGAECLPSARVNRWYHLPERLERVSERLRSIRIENRDARELISMFKNRPATLMYLDPPYNIARKQHYNVDIDENYHIELLDKCTESKAMILISGYENDLYNSKLNIKNGWTKKYLSTSTRDTSGKEHQRTEVLWTNEYFEYALKVKNIPIELDPKEIQLNKLNPER